MSLINQMLQDLERREPSLHPMPGIKSDAGEPDAEARAAAASWVSAEEEEPDRPNRALLAGLGLAALLVVAGGAWWMSRESTPHTVVASQETPVEEMLPQVPAIETEPAAKAEVPELPAPTPKPVRAEKPVPPPVKAAAVTAAAPKAVATATSAVPRAEQLFQQAQAELQQNQAEAAQKSLRGSLEADPKHVQARLTLARLLTERKQLPAAADLLADGVMLQPQQPAFVLALAPLWFQSGQQDDALALLSQSANQSSSTPQLHGFYAGQLLRLKRHAESAVQFRAALRSDPLQVDWLIGLGLALQGAGQNKEALDVLRRAYETGKLSVERKDLVEQMIAGLKSKT